MSLASAFSSPHGKRRYVRRLFGTIADRYDLITRILSAGRDRRWKARLVALAAPTRGEATLDLACGTGDLAFAVAGRADRVVGLDITPWMAELARAKGDAVAFLVGDMMALPFGDRVFDLVTTGYGLRNVPVIETALREAHRVLRPVRRARLRPPAFLAGSDGVSDLPDGRGGVFGDAPAPGFRDLSLHPGFDSPVSWLPRRGQRDAGARLSRGPSPAGAGRVVGDSYGREVTGRPNGAS